MTNHIVEVGTTLLQMNTQKAIVADVNALRCAATGRINLLGPLKDLNLACSGGPDSLGALEFMLKGKHRPTIYHFNHGTKHAQEAIRFMKEYCHEKSLKLVTGTIRGEKPKRLSWEEWWRNERYHFLTTSTTELIATAHNLDDVAETWLMGAIHGTPKLIPYRRNNIVRPFLLTTKDVLKSHAERWVDDPSNRDLKFDRPKIRNMMHLVKSVNPGYLKVIRKKIRGQYERESHCTA